MKKFIAMICSTKPDLNGDVFSEEALKKLAESPLPIPLTVGFKPDAELGKVTALRVIDGTLIAKGEANFIRDFDGLGLVPVIGYLYDVDDEDKVQLLETSLVLPDKALTPGTWIKEDM